MPASICYQLATKILHRNILKFKTSVTKSSQWPHLRRPSHQNWFWCLVWWWCRHYLNIKVFSDLDQPTVFAKIPLVQLIIYPHWLLNFRHSFVSSTWREDVDLSVLLVAMHPVPVVVVGHAHTEREREVLLLGDGLGALVGMHVAVRVTESQIHEMPVAVWVGVVTLASPCLHLHVWC